LIPLSNQKKNSKFLITEESKSENRVSSKIFKVEPSSVLKRVKDFLPKMKEADEALEKELHVKCASELDIENVEDSAPYIEMSLALIETEEDENKGSSEESDDNENVDSDEIQTQEIDCGHVTEENFVISRTVKGHVKPVIEEIATDKRNNLKKNKKRVTSKKGSRKRKQR